MSTHSIVDFLLDFRDSTHLTNDITQIANPKPYQGTDQILVGNGHKMKINIKGQGLLPTPHCKIIIYHIYQAPNFSHKLLFVPKITQDNYYSISFDANGYILKDLKTNQPILYGPSFNGHCQLDLTSKLFPKVFDHSTTLLNPSI